MKTELELLTEKISAGESRSPERILTALEWVRKREAAGQTLGGGSPLQRAAGAALIIIEMNLDADTVIAALVSVGLNGQAPDDSLRAVFGTGAALLVHGAARLAGVTAKNKTIREAQNIRNMLFAMSEDIRVILIKLAERLSTLRTADLSLVLQAPPVAQEMPAQTRKSLAKECLDVYAPLADRLGISWIKDEMEDLSLKILNREAYQQIKDIVAEKRGERNDFLNRAQDSIKQEAEEAGIKIEASSRAKHFYSIYLKMRKRNKSAAEIFDLFGIRILCGSIENCYTLLGIVHRLWKPIDGRFKDYIAMPKSNGYQSLHTTVISPAGQSDAAAGALDAAVAADAGPGDGRLLEIQIRTREMHDVAEFGIASHWLYKKGTVRELVRPLDISIVNRVKDWKQSENTRNAASASYLEDIKREILRDSIYVFTPQGNVIELPSGATPIDFAYSIHTAVGEHCAGAKADGSIIPLSSGLKNAQVVEILTSQAAHPHLNWLRLVKTSKARSKIRAWLEQHDDSIIIEKNIVAKKKPAQPESAVLKGSAGAAPVVQRVIQHSSAEVLHVRVEDEKNLMIRFARCCRPVAGDAISGYVSRGRGIIVHRKNCASLANIPDFAERQIETEWENAVSVLVKRFKVEARLSADLFSEIEGAIRKRAGHLIEGRLEETAANRLTGFFTMQLAQAGDLKAVLKNIRGIPGILNLQPLG